MRLLIFFESVIDMKNTVFKGVATAIVTPFKDGKIVNAGGRVLGVSARGKDIPEAIANAYKAVDEISFEGGFCRRDIGAKALKHGGK